MEPAALLIARGADVNAKDDDGETPLFGAAEMGNLSMARFLVSKGADVRILNKKGETIASQAEFFGYADMAAYLNEIAKKKQ